MSRHGRQTQLVEIGSAGQERIAESTAVVRGEGLAAEVATRYLAGAGVRCIRVREPALAVVAASIDPAVRVEIDERAAESEAPRSASVAHDFRDAAARHVALGAREALHALRTALGYVS